MHVKSSLGGSQSLPIQSEVWKSDDPSLCGSDGLVRVQCTGRPSALPVQSNVPNHQHEDDLGDESIGNFLLSTINKLVSV